jgi:hypothetical protein
VICLTARPADPADVELVSQQIPKLLENQETLVDNMRKEMETVAEPVVPAESAAAAEGSDFDDDDEETAGEQEPSILHVLNED